MLDRSHSLISRPFEKFRFRESRELLVPDFRYLEKYFGDGVPEESKRLLEGLPAKGLEELRKKSFGNLLFLVYGDGAEKCLEIFSFAIEDYNRVEGSKYLSAAKKWFSKIYKKPLTRKEREIEIAKNMSLLAGAKKEINDRLVGLENQISDALNEYEGDKAPDLLRLFSSPTGIYSKDGRVYECYSWIKLKGNPEDIEIAKSSAVFHRLEKRLFLRNLFSKAPYKKLWRKLRRLDEETEEVSMINNYQEMEDLPELNAISDGLVLITSKKCKTLEEVVMHPKTQRLVEELSQKKPSF